MEPKNGGLEVNFRFQLDDFQVPSLIFQGLVFPATSFLRGLYLFPFVGGTIPSLSGEVDLVSIDQMKVWMC